MRISDWSSDVCSSDLIGNEPYGWWQIGRTTLDYFMLKHNRFAAAMSAVDPSITLIGSGAMPDQLHPREAKERSEEHASELQSLMRISSAVFCLNKKKTVKV